MLEMKFKKGLKVVFNGLVGSIIAFLAGLFLVYLSVVLLKLSPVIVMVVIGVPMATALYGTCRLVRHGYIERYYTRMLIGFTTMLVVFFVKAASICCAIALFSK
jgi:hypothetical protein